MRLVDLNGPKWSILVSRMLNPVRNKVILTKMVVWTILDHFGPVHFPTVPRSFPSNWVLALWCASEGVMCHLGTAFVRELSQRYWSMDGSSQQRLLLMGRTL